MLSGLYGQGNVLGQVPGSPMAGAPLANAAPQFPAIPQQIQRGFSLPQMPMGQPLVLPSTLQQMGIGPGLQNAQNSNQNIAGILQQLKGLIAQAGKDGSTSANMTNLTGTNPTQIDQDSSGGLPTDPAQQLALINLLLGNKQNGQ